MITRTLLLALLTLSSAFAHSTDNEKLVVGVALHPYYSYVSKVVGDKAEVLPLLDAGFNPHSYQAQVQDLQRLKRMDVIVINGIGHDHFAEQIIASAADPDLKVIYANKDVALLPAVGSSVGDGAVNPHTFVGLSTTIQKVYTIANELGQIDPANAKVYRNNARDFARTLRKLKRNASDALTDIDTSTIKVATTHNAYGYLLQEFGVEVEAVIEPAHGVEPSASQLQGTIDKINAAGINVLFYELNMPNRFVDTIEQSTGVKLYQFSHLTHGAYQTDKVEKEMASNLNTLVEAFQFAAENKG
ncbi:metal ABC transporter solute-binding protein, Zn/Mn family [Ferrimonas lipolytica]|uniref:High-affinity zinc uptake system protein ZnuA n=1 Tax=Ferrimonas lipolytica TaxID=2724191 RepID=A0A6H1UDB9_9GAMM|nr:zinc ABC transporter substrate-binding protein [Ferrimonas lipolytica]QIZ77071.1 zinc ABC transporter solute-binding protein [Ferrimonas lipolytica]